MRCVLSVGVRKEDELMPGHYRVYGGNMQGSTAIKQLTFALPVNPLTTNLHQCEVLSEFLRAATLK